MKHIHFVAIGGTGMGALAGLLKSRGLHVTGSDKKIYPPMSDALEKWGISVTEGFSAENLTSPDGSKPDLVIVGNAVGPDNLEARAAIDGGYRYLSFPDALYELAIKGKHSVVVAGTHGKTTVTSLIATLLHETGQDPSMLVGGITGNFDGSFREGHGSHFVVEGDEYDTAFFDKTPKFLHYGPQTLVITSVEFDHADIYRDLEHVQQAFREVVSRMPSDGCIVAAVDKPNVRDVIEKAPCRVVGYGVGADSQAEWKATDLEVEAAGTSFVLSSGDENLGRVEAPIFGEFNVENVLASLAVLDALGVEGDRVRAALAAYRGVKRRQEVRGEVAGVTVIDDFAHHPTAVSGTVEAVSKRYAGRKLIAVFEPRTNTSRRKIFQTDYAKAFEAAQRVLLSIVPDEPIYSATGEVGERFSAEQLASDLEARGISAQALPGPDAIVELLDTELESGDVVLIMSNGAFGGIWKKLLDRLGRR